MSAWLIFDKNGNAKCEARKLEYQGEFLGACSVSVSVSAPTPIGFAIGDWLEYRGERFELNYDPSVVKEASSGSYGEGFVYENVVFNSLSDELTRCDFLDVVPSDNGMHYSSLPTFSFYAEGVSALVERIQVNLDRVYTGDKAWTIEIHPEYVNTKNATVSASNLTCWDALALVKSQFDANFIIKGRTITIGTSGIAVDSLFSYGKGNGLVTIERNAESNQKIVTRLRAYGSTRNMPSGYYRNLSENVPNNMAVTNLMLPSFPADTLDPYLDSEKIDELGVREGTVFFDGSGDLEEIYPTMEGMTAEDLKSAGIDVDAEGALDVVVSAEQITDDGVAPEEGEIQGTFTITLKDIGFDLNDYLSTTGSATIAMKDGMCGGREFEITKCEKEGSGYVLTCNRAEDTGLGLYFPYKDYQIKEGDKFVLLNLEMPDVYIQAASQRLLAAAKEYLSKNDYVRYSFTPAVDNIFLARQHEEAVANGGVSIHDTIKEGDFIMFEDDDLGISGSITIDSLSIKEDAEGSMIPEYEITLKEEKSVGTIEKIQNQISSILNGSVSVNGGGGLTSEQVKSIVSAVGGKLFLSKVKDDRSKGKVASDVGFEVGEYVSGASGAIIYKDATTGQTVGELDKLRVRMKAYFETLEIINVNSVGGKMILSPAGSVKCVGVETLEDAYRCYFLGEQDGELIENRFVAGDQAFSQMFNAKVGVSNKVSNHYYWRLVTAVSEETVEYDGKQCHYIDLSIADCDADSDVPKVGDVINQRGSREDADRMNFIEFSSVDAFSPNITLFHGVNSYSLDGKAYVDYGVDKSTNKAYMNVYGDMYVGDRNETAYLRYTQEGGLEICGKLAVGSTYNGSEIGSLFDKQKEDLESFASSVVKEFENIRNEMDGVIDTWFGEETPTLDNYPASEWATDTDKDSHLGDLYYTNDGKAYRFQYTETDGYYWSVIEDSEVVKALELAQKAQDTADGKRRVFIDTPYPPYDLGDLWAGGKDSPLKRCINARESGSYYESDWALADDTHAYADAVKAELEKTVSTTKTDLEKAITDAEAAANTYTDEAKTAINKTINELEAAKANIDDVYTKATADEEISKAEQAAIDAAKKASDAAIALSEVTVKAYADGVVDEEEKARIKQAEENLEAAKAYAEEKAAEALEEANKNIATFDYLKAALNEVTTIDGGLILSSLIKLQHTDNIGSHVMSGINGIYNEESTGGGIATWWGGDIHEWLDYYEWDGAWKVKDDVEVPTNMPSGAIRFDGTGYFANGNFWWDADGQIHADPTALLLSFDVETGDETLAATIINIRKEIAQFNSMWTLKTDASGNSYLLSSYHLATNGGVTMYSADGVEVGTVFDALPIDNATIYWDGDVLKAKVGTEGAITSITKDMVVDALGYTPLENHQSIYALTIQKNGTSVGTYTPNSAAKTINITVPTKVSELTNDSKYITGITYSLVTSALGYTPFDSTNFTTANIKDVLGISDWALASSKPSYTTSEVSEGTNLYFTDARAQAALADSLSLKLDASSYTAADVLAKLKTVDGSGSGLDADLLDGYSSTEFALQRKLFSKGNYEWYVVLLDKVVYDGSSSYSRYNGKLYTAQNGASRYYAADFDFYYSVWSTGSQLKVRLDNYGLDNTAWSLVKCTYNGIEYYALRFTMSMTLTAYFCGTINYGNLTAIHYYTSDTSTIVNEEIYNSIEEVEVSQPYSNGSKYALVSDNVASATKLQTARTIWGQSFDGSADVSGSLSGVTDISMTGALSGATTGTFSGEVAMGSAKVNGGSLTYDATNGYWKLEGDLLVTGGVSMYSSDTAFTPSTIMDGVVVDDVTIGKNANGALYFAGSIDGGVASSVEWDNISGVPSWIGDTKPSYAYSEISGTPTLLSSFTNDVGYLTAHQTIYGLTINNSGGTSVLSYTPNSKAASLTLTKDMVGLGSVENTALSTWKGTTNITTLGTITSGTWNGSKIANAYLANSSMTISGTSVSLGGSITQTALRTALGLGSNAYTSTAYLPLSGGTVSSSEQIPLLISSSFATNSTTGLSIKNTNITNASGNTFANAQFGCAESNGVFMFNYYNYNNVNCAIGITNDGVAYIGKGSAIDTKYTIWHAGNDGSGSGLDADLLDGKHNGELSAIYLTHTGISDANTFGNLGTVSYCNTISPSLSNIPGDTNSWQQAILSIGLHNTSNLQAQFYMSRGHNLYYRSDRNRNWGKLAFTTDNVESANKLKTARTIWGKSFDGTGNVDGSLSVGNNGSIAVAQSDGLGAGLSLYGSAEHVQNFGIWFGITATWGTHSIVSGDWATYFSMGGADNRGWVFRHASNGCVASISSTGEFSTNGWMRTIGAKGWYSQTYGGGLYMEDNSLLRTYGGKIFYIGHGGTTTTADYNAMGLRGHDLTLLVGSSMKHSSIMLRSSTASWSLCSNSNGNMYIGKRYSTSHSAAASDAYTLMLSGQDLLCYGGITMYSDIRKKTKLQDVELTLKQVADAPLIEHYYNGDKNKTTHVGSIAQYWAGMNDWFCKEDGEGFLTMEIQNAALASAISVARELVKYESKTDRKIRLLKKRISELEDEIDKLKNK